MVIANKRPKEQEFLLFDILKDSIDYDTWIWFLINYRRLLFLHSLGFQRIKDLSIGL